VRAAMGRLEVVCDTYLSVSTPVQMAAATLLVHGTPVREQIQQRVQANYRRAIELTSGTCVRALPAEGGWYVVLSVPALGPEEDLVVDLLEKSGVLAHPGYFFDFARGSFLVASLLGPETEFAEGLARILRHFDCNR
jgi:alanine-synthesizing transaminase